MTLKRISLVEDSDYWRQATGDNIQDFMGEAEMVVGTNLTEGIRLFRENIGKLHAGLLDFDLNVIETSIPLYEEMLRTDRAFAEQRVASLSSLSNEAIEGEYNRAGVPPPKIFIEKGQLRKLLAFLENLPAVGAEH